jgi:hypothetical protein
LGAIQRQTKRVRSMTIPTNKDCQLVSKALEAALLELERLSERSMPPKPTRPQAADHSVVGGAKSRSLLLSGLSGFCLGQRSPTRT